MDSNIIESDSMVSRSSNSVDFFKSAKKKKRETQRVEHENGTLFLRLYFKSGDKALNAVGDGDGF